MFATFRLAKSATDAPCEFSRLANCRTEARPSRHPTTLFQWHVSPVMRVVVGGVPVPRRSSPRCLKRLRSISWSDRWGLLSMSAGGVLAANSVRLVAADGRADGKRSERCTDNTTPARTPANAKSNRRRSSRASAGFFRSRVRTTPRHSCRPRAAPGRRAAR